MAIGVPHATVDGVVGAGLVLLLYAVDGNGLDETGELVDHRREGSAAVPDTPEVGDGFGSNLEAAHFGRGAGRDLAVGVPGEDVKGVVDAGAVDVLYQPSTGGQNSAFMPAGTAPDQRVTQASPLVRGPSRHARALRHVALGREHRRLGSGQTWPSGPLVKPPAGHPRAGSVQVLYSTVAGGLTAFDDEVWNQPVAGIADEPDDNERFGTGLP